MVTSEPLFETFVAEYPVLVNLGYAFIIGGVLITGFLVDHREVRKQIEVVHGATGIAHHGCEDVFVSHGVINKIHAGDAMDKNLYDLAAHHRRPLPVALEIEDEVLARKG